MAPAPSDALHRAARRSRLRTNPSFTLGASEPRKTSRRLFGRSASTTTPSAFLSHAPPAPTPVAEDDDLPARRTFLAKPPAPGAARRVLSVLRDPAQKRASNFAAPASRRSAPSLARSGYDEDAAGRGEASTDGEGSRSGSDAAAELLRAGRDALLRAAAPSEGKVRARAEDERDSAKSDSVASSMHSAHAAPPSGILEVEASEVSDEINSNADRSTRSRRGSSSSAPTVETDAVVQEPDDLLFIDDVEPASIAFNCVGDGEEEVPEAPTSFDKKMGAGVTWSAYEERVQSLQAELGAVRAEKAQMETAFEQQNRELEVLLQSLRVRAAESSAEVQELTRQLKDTRRRLTRRIRELEEDAAIQKVHHSDEITRHRGVETQLRAEFDRLRGMGQRFTRTESTPTLPARRQRPVSLQATAHATHHHDSVPGSRAATAESVSSGGHATPNVSRVKSTGNVHEPVRRRNSRTDILHSTSLRSLPPARRSVTSSLDAGVAYARTTARRSLLRRSFIAHIHSTKYRSVRSAWHDFLGGESGHITPEQFARAVRSLAIASDARDRDLERLREEVCGAELCDTGVVTWAMFVRFYQRTKHEST